MPCLPRDRVTLHPGGDRHPLRTRTCSPHPRVRRRNTRNQVPPDHPIALPGRAPVDQSISPPNPWPKNLTPRMSITKAITSELLTASHAFHSASVLVARRGAAKYQITGRPTPV